MRGRDGEREAFWCYYGALAGRMLGGAAVVRSLSLETRAQSPEPRARRQGLEPQSMEPEAAKRIASVGWWSKQISSAAK